MCDNECLLPLAMPCIWNSTEEAMEKEMWEYLNGKDPGHWMGTYSMEFTMDVAERTMTSREVLLYGDI